MSLDKDKTHLKYGKTRVFLHEVIFEADTPLGRVFDIILLISILLSVLAVMLDSVESINADYGYLLYKVEWFFTIIFTVEYVLRLLCVGRPFRYATSFFGAVDLLAIVPTYLSILIPGSQYLLIIRVLRVLRVFRILKIVQYVGEAHVLVEAMRASKRKIIIFLFAILNIVTILGSVMYLIEGKEHGFTSIPEGIYWAIVTLTTVGYGDIAPGTPFGKAVGSFIMILGYGIIAVPT
ncbi:MAG: ion transporter, partial [Nitrospirae bacterium]|nr:ion transporter [Nitrospirota bacterium]